MASPKAMARRAALGRGHKGLPTVKTTPPVPLAEHRSDAPIPSTRQRHTLRACLPNVSSPLPSERCIFTDSETGARVTQWTSSPALDRPLYFTSPSVTRDDRWLVLLSERDGGSPNFFAIERASGLIHRLTNNTQGSLASYCYPSENRSGIGKSSPCLDPDRNILYYIKGYEVWRVSLEGDRVPQKLATLPAGWWTAFTHVSADGRWLCVPCTHPDAFPPGQSTQWEQLDNMYPRLKDKGLVSRIYLIETATGRSRILAELPFWVTHVNFAPDDSGKLLVNSEGPQSSRHGSPPRIWCVESDGSHHPLFEQNGMRVNHENFARDQPWIIYHGGYEKNGEARRRNFVAARDWTGSPIFEYALEDLPLMHATPMNNPRWSVVDTPEHIAMICPDTQNRPALIPLCRHHSREGFGANQDHHCHPLQTLAGGGVVFASNREGEANVYEVHL